MSLPIGTAVDLFAPQDLQNSLQAAVSRIDAEVLKMAAMTAVARNEV
jgi:hypothetical protein